jgi:hemoglobin
VNSAARTQGTAADGTEVRGRPAPVAAVGAAAPAAAAARGNPHFERIGGAAAVERLSRRFYEAMAALPEARAIRALHPADLESSREKLYAYLVGWLGGPPLYTSRHGPPRLRQRHLPFPIGDAQRDAWLLCMDTALADVVADTSLRAELRAAFAKTADFLRNR